MAALSRMAASIHKKVSIKPGDAIIFSSTPIPGNEKAVSKIMNELSQQGAKVIFQDTHVSGHACQEEQKLMGIDKDNIFLLQSGNVLSLGEDYGAVVGNVQAGGILVDGLGVGDVGNIVLRDRQNLAENGIIIVVMTLERGTNAILAGPDIVTRGFVYVREAENLIEEARKVVSDALDDCLQTRVSDWGKIKMAVKDSLNEYLWKKMHRHPMILPIIMEVD